MSLLTRACSSLPRARQRPLYPAVSSLAKMPAPKMTAALEPAVARRPNSVTAKRNLVAQK